MSFNIKDSLLLTGTVAAISFAGWKANEAQGPGPQPQYAYGTPEVNERVNNELIATSVQKCLESGTIDGKKFREDRRAILGSREGNLRILCQQIKDVRDRVFTVQIGIDAYMTRDGQVYFRTGNIVPVKDE